MNNDHPDLRSHIFFSFHFIVAISNVKVQGIEPSQPQSSKSRYVPPHCRGGNCPAPPTRGSVSAINNASPAERPAIPGLPIGYKTGQGQRKKDKRDIKRAQEYKTKLEAATSKPPSNDPNVAQTAQQPSAQPQGNQSESNNRRRNRPQQNNNQNHATNGVPSNTPNNQSNPPNSVSINQNENIYKDGPDNENNSDRSNNRNRRPRRNKDTVVVSTGDPEQDKNIRARIRIIQQKLRDIVRLKAKRDTGDGIDANQLSKINTEEDLVRELNALKVSA